MARSSCYESLAKPGGCGWHYVSCDNDECLRKHLQHVYRRELRQCSRHNNALHLLYFFFCRSRLSCTASPSISFLPSKKHRYIEEVGAQMQLKRSSCQQSRMCSTLSLAKLTSGGILIGLGNRRFKFFTCLSEELVVPLTPFDQRSVHTCSKHIWRF